MTITLRNLRRNPGFASIALETIALGIGGTAAIFGVMNAVLFKPLPYFQSVQLVRLNEITPGSLTQDKMVASGGQAAFRSQNCPSFALAQRR